MSVQADIDRLAASVGIAPFFHDIWGNRRDVSRETKRALLAAMGFVVESDADVAATLNRLDLRKWSRVLPPVLVGDEGETPSVPVTLPADVGDATLTWSVREEGGTTHDGHVRFQDLDMVETGAIADAAYHCRRFELPVGLPCGYHDLRIGVVGASGENPGAATRLIVAPRRCWLPEEVRPDGRLSGISLQLYALRSERNWGVGDFGDLSAVTAMVSDFGLDMVGLNPLHALFPADPNHCSPYSPSNRAFIDVLYIDVGGIPDLDDAPEARRLIENGDFRQRLEVARSSDLVDYAEVAALKLPVLDHLHAAFRRRHLAQDAVSPRGEAFRRYRDEMGDSLRRQALFDALHEHFFRQDPGRWAWQTWPEPFRDPNSSEVAAFARDHAERIEFFQYLQWVADEQLQRVADQARAAGLAVGLYRDLAVANHPGGAAAWANQGIVLEGASVGAPPDMFNPNGQNWGLAPLSPIGLQETAYEIFINGIRANMRHAGAIRIDHVMALRHLFWIPAGVRGEGAYVAYPFDDLIRIIALESRRNRCLVIGEDLGTVPEGFRPAIQSRGVLSCRVLIFERDGDGGFVPPDHYPENALVSINTHDLPTFRGFWTGRDLEWRRDLGLYATPEAQDEDRRDRDRSRDRLVGMLCRIGVLPDDLADEAREGGFTRDLLAAVHRFIAMTPSRMLVASIEDMIGEREQPNLPGTVEEHPNWRRKLGRSIAEIAADPDARALAGIIRETASEGVVVRSGRGA